MARTLKVDRWLFYTTLLLVGLSVVMVYSASAVPAVRRFESTAEHFLFRQLAYAIGGFFLLFGAMRVDYHVFQRPAVIWSLFVVTFVCLIAVFAWPERNGAQRWIDLWIVSFQPSELAKLTLIVFTARVLDCRMHRIGELGYAVAPIATASVLLISLIYLEPDMGTSVMVAVIVGSMLFAAGLRLPHLAVVGLVAVAAVALAIAVAPYRVARLMQMFTGGHQLNQSIIAIGSGGFGGLGLTQGIQKLFYLPEAHTDFIFAVIGEELGLVGTTVVVACFLFMAWRGLRIALLAPDRFGALLAVGITAMIALQALINITVVMGLAPTKGIPLPFVSSGGSSLVMNLTAMGILLNVSQQALPPKAMPASQRSWILGQELPG